MYGITQQFKNRKMKPKYNFRDMVVYQNIVYRVSSVRIEPLPFAYYLERVCPEGEMLQYIPESLLKAWDGRIDSRNPIR